MKKLLFIAIFNFLIITFTACNNATSEIINSETIDNPIENINESKELKEYTLEELIVLNSEASMQNRYCAIKKGNTIKQFDNQKRCFSEKDDDNNIIEHDSVKELSFLTARLEEIKKYENVTISLETDMISIPMEPLYCISVTYENNNETHYEIFYLKEDSLLLVGIAYPDGPGQNETIYKVSYSDNSFIENKVE